MKFRKKNFLVVENAETLQNFITYTKLIGVEEECRYFLLVLNMVQFERTNRLLIEGFYISNREEEIVKEYISIFGDSNENP